MKKIIKILLKSIEFKDLIAFIIDLCEGIIRIRKLKKIQSLKKINRVRISVKRNSFSKNIRLQSKKGLGLVNRSLFVTTLRTDVNVVINNPNFYIPLNSRLKENWLIHIEPPGYINKLGYDVEKQHSKFTRIYTSDPALYERGGKYIASPPFVHWHIDNSSYTKDVKELHDYDYLEQIHTSPEKKDDLAVINSNINDLPGHKLRSEFIKKMCNANIDFKLYGGTNWKDYPQYVDNAPKGKWPIFSKARYVLVIENEVSPFYWSEKLTDTILCWGMPIYYGSPNIGDYLPKGSYVHIDINNEDAIEKLMNIIKSDYYEQNINSLRKARELILKKYNILSFLDSEIENCLK